MSLSICTIHNVAKSVRVKTPRLSTFVVLFLSIVCDVDNSLVTACSSILNPSCFLRTPPRYFIKPKVKYSTASSVDGLFFIFDGAVQRNLPNAKSIRSLFMQLVNMPSITLSPSWHLKGLCAMLGAKIDRNAMVGASQSAKRASGQLSSLKRAVSVRITWRAIFSTLIWPGWTSPRVAHLGNLGRYSTLVSCTQSRREGCCSMTGVVGKEAVGCCRGNSTWDGMTNSVTTLLGGAVPYVTMEFVIEAVTS